MACALLFLPVLRRRRRNSPHASMRHCTCWALIMTKTESNAPVEDTRSLGNPESERNPSGQIGSEDEDIVGQADDEDDFDDEFTKELQG